PDGEGCGYFASNDDTTADAFLGRLERQRWTETQALRALDGCFRWALKRVVEGVRWRMKRILQRVTFGSAGRFPQAASSVPGPQRVPADGVENGSFGT